MSRLPRLLAAAACLTPVLALSGSASAEAPTVQAWWSATNIGAAAAPAPPDVQSGDLLVQGSNSGAGAPSGLPLGTSQAIAGLVFRVPEGAALGALTLALDPGAHVQSGSTIVACRATAEFAAVENGPYADVPPYDAQGCVPAALNADGTALVLAQVAGLVRKGSLALVLLPGPLDRVVIAPLTDAALAVTDAPAPGGSFNPGAPPAGFTGVPVGGGSAPFTGSAGSAVPDVSPPLSQPAPAVAPGSAPVLAPPAQTTSPRAAVVRPRAPATGLARLVAGIALGLLLVGSAVAMRRGRGLVADGPAGQTRGVGRFRAARSGRSPGLS